MNIREKNKHRLSIYPIGKVEEITGISAKRIRHWEDYGLVCPARTAGGHRLFSTDQVELLLRIKELIETDGLRLAGVKKLLEHQTHPAKKMGGN